MELVAAVTEDPDHGLLDPVGVLERHSVDWPDISDLRPPGILLLPMVPESERQLPDRLADVQHLVAVVAEGIDTGWGVGGPGLAFGVTPFFSRIFRALSLTLSGLFLR